jgi:hypothetical protein
MSRLVVTDGSFLFLIGMIYDENSYSQHKAGNTAQISKNRENDMYHLPGKDFPQS